MSNLIFNPSKVRKDYGEWGEIPNPHIRSLQQGGATQQDLSQEFVPPEDQYPDVNQMVGQYSPNQNDMQGIAELMPLLGRENTELIIAAYKEGERAGMEKAAHQMSQLESLPLTPEIMMQHQTGANRIKEVPRIGGYSSVRPLPQYDPYSTWDQFRKLMSEEAAETPGAIADFAGNAAAVARNIAPGAYDYISQALKEGRLNPQPGYSASEMALGEGVQGMADDYGDMPWPVGVTEIIGNPAKAVAPLVFAGAKKAPGTIRNLPKSKQRAYYDKSNIESSEYGGYESKPEEGFERFYRSGDDPDPQPAGNFRIYESNRERVRSSDKDIDIHRVGEESSKDLDSRLIRSLFVKGLGKNTRVNLHITKDQEDRLIESGFRLDRNSPEDSVEILRGNKSLRTGNKGSGALASWYYPRLSNVKQIRKGEELAKVNSQIEVLDEINRSNFNRLLSKQDPSVYSKTNPTSPVEVKVVSYKGRKNITSPQSAGHHLIVNDVPHDSIIRIDRRKQNEKDKKSLIKTAEKEIDELSEKLEELRQMFGDDSDFESVIEAKQTQLELVEQRLENIINEPAVAKWKQDLENLRFFIKDSDENPLDLFSGKYAEHNIGILEDLNKVIFDPKTGQMISPSQNVGKISVPSPTPVRLKQGSEGYSNRNIIIESSDKTIDQDFTKSKISGNLSKKVISPEANFTDADLSDLSFDEFTFKTLKENPTFESAKHTLSKEMRAKHYRDEVLDKGLKSRKARVLSRGDIKEIRNRTDIPNLTESSKQELIAYVEHNEKAREIAGNSEDILKKIFGLRDKDKSRILKLIAQNVGFDVVRELWPREIRKFLMKDADFWMDLEDGIVTKIGKPKLTSKPKKHKPKKISDTESSLSPEEIEKGKEALMETRRMVESGEIGNKQN